VNRNVFKYLGEGTKLFAVVLLFFFIGDTIDNKLETKYFALVFSFSAIASLLFYLVRKVSSD